MNKSILYIALVIVFFACKKDEPQPPVDPRDKFVGYYEGLLVPTGANNAPISTGQFAEVTLTKHPTIDNALIVNSSTHPPIVGTNIFAPYTGFGTFSTYWYDAYEKNRLYISDEGFLYQNNMNRWDFYVDKLCYYVNPDSLYFVVYYNEGMPSGPWVNDFFVKVKKVN